MCRRNVRGDQADLDAQRPRRGIRRDVAAAEIHLRQLVCRKSQGRTSCFELAVCAGLMKETPMEPKRLLKEGKGRRDVRHIDDGVAKLHDDLPVGPNARDKPTGEASSA